MAQRLACETPVAHASVLRYALCRREPAIELDAFFTEHQRCGDLDAGV
jgi:hypothetical protein